MQTPERISSEKLLQRFIRYAKIWTTSDPHGTGSPTTSRQWELLHLLASELEEMGVAVELDDQGFLIGRLSARGVGPGASTVGFMAHVDTSPDVSGKDVSPIIHRRWQGTAIELKNSVILDPERMTDLASRKGDTIITSDGTSLLGADDKAGIAEIMAAIEYLQANPELPHGPLEIIFTPDEETGKGMDRFPRDRIQSRCCYTLDGDESGTLEAECFTAYRADISFFGVAAHPGRARGRLVNAISMLGSFLGMLPRSESPEATDGRYGFYHGVEVSGHTEKAELTMILRDFEMDEVERRVEALRSFASALEAAYPGGKVKVAWVKQYLNMRDAFKKDPLVVDLARKAVSSLGLNPIMTSIRGGTDGARLSELGIPTPNLFTGGHNFHSLSEWASLEVMTYAAETILALALLWGEIESPPPS
ncbi:peptidase T [Marispirochaeta sp.]|jgi:tripeptide aminopeptidase|uniref:peptidase T n=1 Tax=Marispirochaeta sp. TaxID=2038653 RepID=UPI0029C6A9D9|nr:peptidase T [Marispirochaeta sp.]